MNKIRRFEVTNNLGEYSIVLDKTPCNAAEIIEAMNSYHSELDDTDNTIAIIMRSLRTTHNLSDDEYREYERTLQYILKD